MEQIIGTISIWIKGREKSSYEINKILTENSSIILSRMGYNIQPQCISDCFAVITLVVRGKKDELERLNNLIRAVDKVDSKLLMLSE
ncbi:MAG TPA: hypothetical protein PLA41_02140 [Candidatus Pacearchaeota archaeon]|nr:hypothetical protein [Candidatus Parcubacteria bacterium]HNZ83956.1 hypothetical protein [Candidatus Pacearchaeota archaeon]HOU45927.1 hypothetical protein [Candidatus Pacearchaeota archaeon]HPM08220.1 hypothetical protein [Candidatus Pacearchaeota archaeon]HQI74460.1 hypothetical protein [Candidatus Pacearchaeota archaeon]